MRRFTASIHCVDSGPRDSEISYAFAYVFAASAASAAKCFHTEVWARGPNTPGPRGPSVWKHFNAEAAEVAKT